MCKIGLLDVGATILFHEKVIFLIVHYAGLILFYFIASPVAYMVLSAYAVEMTHTGSRVGCSLLYWKCIVYVLAYAMNEYI